MAARIKSYNEFYKYYLSQHQIPGTRILHFAGTLITLMVLIYVLASGKERFLWYILILGCGLPLLSHFVFERNRPTFLNYPVWTIVSDFKMFFELITAKIKFKA